MFSDKQSHDHSAPKYASANVQADSVSVKGSARRRTFLSPQVGVLWMIHVHLRCVCDADTVWRTHSPGEQEHSRHAESHQDAHRHDKWQVAGTTRHRSGCWNEELREEGGRTGHVTSPRGRIPCFLCVCSSLIIQWKRWVFSRFSAEEFATEERPRRPTPMETRRILIYYWLVSN